MVRFWRLLPLPKTPFDRLNLYFSAQIDINPSFFVGAQAWKFKASYLAIFIDAQLKFLVVWCRRNRMPMRRLKMLRKIMDCFVDILGRVFDARWEMTF